MASAGLIAGEDVRDPSTLTELSEGVTEIRDRLRLDPKLRLEGVDEERETAEGEEWSPVFPDGTAVLDERLLDLENTEASELAWSQLRVGATAPVGGGDGDGAVAVVVQAAATDDGLSLAEPVSEQAQHRVDFTCVNKLKPIEPAPTTDVSLPRVTSWSGPFALTWAKRPVNTWNLKASVAGALAALALVIGLAVGLDVAGPTTREHFLAIDEVEWDYAPSGKDTCHAAAFGYKSAKIMDGAPANRIGRKYLKAQYVEYTDASFATKLVRTDAAAWAHLGSLGPVLRAEVGDRLRVTLRNNARFTFSLHARGAYGDKSSEGAGYNDGSFWFKKKDDAVEPFGLGAKTCRKQDFLSPKQIERRRLLEADAPPAWKRTVVDKDRITPKAHPDADSCSVYEVLPGENRVYSWDVRAADGPGPADGNSALWLYQSHVGGQGAEIHTGGLGLGDDVNAGLLGPILITKKGASVDKAKVYPAGHALAGKLDPAGLKPVGLDKEFVTVMSVTDENASPYLKANVYKYIVEPLFRPATPGFVAFGSLDKGRVLTKLYEVASHGADKLGYAAADAAYKTANNAHNRVDKVNGRSLKVWFNENQFDPTKFDAMYGLNAAQNAVDGLKHDLVDYHDPHFIESNMMHGINGRTHCNLPQLELATGDVARWYVASVGSHGDMHSPHWHGNTGIISGGDAADGGARADIFELIAGGTRTFDMTADNPGTWLYHCHVNDHIEAGMNAFYKVTGGAALTQANVDAKLKLTAVVREYFVQAETIDWDYAKTGAAVAGSLAADTCSGLPLDATRGRTVTKAADRIGTVYRKAQYVRYTDATFATKHVIPAEEAHLGILGPVLRAEVGDSLKITFKNHAANARPYSMHPHGVFYLKGQEGAPYADGTSGADGNDDSVAPGATHVYEWQVPDSAGPSPADPSSVVWMYHSHVLEVNNTNAGLVGPIIVTKKGMATSASNPAPKDVDREFILLTAILDENKADFFRENQAKMTSFGGNAAIGASFTAAMAERLKYKQLKDGWYKESNKMHAINGKVFCGLDGLTFADTDKTRLHLMSLGDEHSHVPVFEGQTFLDHGHRTAAPGLMSASMRTIDVAARGGGKYAQPGTWLLHDGVTDHLRHGQKAAFTVTGTAAANLAQGSGATYHIAADEVEWDYAPSGRDLCADASHAKVVLDTRAAQRDAGFEPDTLHQGHHRIGHAYIKARYRQYTSSAWSKLRFGQKSRFNAISEHLGLQGPLMQGSEGDVLTVHFKNKLRFPCNFHVGGGVISRGEHDPTDAVPPGGERTYLLELTSASAPATGSPNEKSTIAYPYFSSLDHAVHKRNTGAGAAARTTAAAVANFAGVDAGLFGVLLVKRRGAAAFPGSEIATVFATLDENRSPYLDMNIAKYAGSGASVDKSDPVFKESNRMHSINGRSYCNLRGLDLLKNKQTRWYQLVLGSTNDVHAPLIYGQAQDVWGHHVAATEVFPGQGVVGDFRPRYPGAWLMQSSTISHAQNGMQAMLNVADRIA